MTLADEGGMIEPRLCQIVRTAFARLHAAARHRHASGNPVSNVVRTSSG
ncbi:hypothetical protein BDSB_18840 [Burkholderia dolosa PC543]|nr:hypothetical protein BDSB_18840 [Burkholderia dolosa PC543]